MAKDRVTLGTVLRLALASLAVGLVLAALDVTPADLLANLSAMAASLWHAARDALGWAGSYMLLGALVVLPIWLLRHVWRRMSAPRD